MLPLRKSSVAAATTVCVDLCRLTLSVAGTTVHSEWRNVREVDMERARVRVSVRRVLGLGCGSRYPYNVTDWFADCVSGLVRSERRHVREVHVKEWLRDTPSKSKASPQLFRSLRDKGQSSSQHCLSVCQSCEPAYQIWTWVWRKIMACFSWILYCFQFRAVIPKLWPACHFWPVASSRWPAKIFGCAYYIFTILVFSTATHSRSVG